MDLLKYGFITALSSSKSICFFSNFSKDAFKFGLRSDDVTRDDVTRKGRF